MKILNEFVPTRKFLKLADEIKDLVDGWNVTDSAGGFPAASGVVVSCILKTSTQKNMFAQYSYYTIKDQWRSEA